MSGYAPEMTTEKLVVEVFMPNFKWICKMLAGKSFFCLFQRLNISAEKSIFLA